MRRLVIPAGVLLAVSVSLGLAGAVVLVSSAGGGLDPRDVPQPSATMSIAFSGTPIVAADGGRVAAAGDSSGPIVWNPATGTKLDVGICDTATIEVALAADQVASVCVEETNTVQERDLDAAWLGHGGASSLAVADEGCAQTCLGNVAGDGDLLVFNTYRTQRAMTLAGRWWLWRIVAGRKVLVLADSKPLAVAAVDGGRIFVRRGNRLLVFNPSGQRLASYPSPGSGRIAVDGNGLVCRTRTGVTVLDLRRGTIAHRWKLPARAVLRDTDSHSFVYTLGATIHLHHLLEPQDAALALRGVKGQLDARLTPSGLFYAWQDVASTGHVAFVPRNDLPGGFR